MRGKPYIYYRYFVYPRVKHLRGTTRFAEFLESIAYSGVEKYSGTPLTVYEFSDEWDNLFIADACRLDLFRETFPGVNAEKRVAVGSSSADYIRNTYSSGDFSDVVYVTGNPHFEPDIFEGLTGRKPGSVFHEVFHTYDTDWSDDEGRPSTEALMRDAETARKLFPDKRLVVHFMKPHHPFTGFDFEGISQDLKLGTGLKDSVWRYAETGKVSWSDVWEGYKYNLKSIFPELVRLDKVLDGKSVVTSDHGNFVGENGLGHHPSYRDAKVLREVPWVEL